MYDANLNVVANSIEKNSFGINSAYGRNRMIATNRTLFRYNHYSKIIVPQTLGHPNMNSKIAMKR